MRLGSFIAGSAVALAACGGASAQAPAAPAWAAVTLASAQQTDVRARATGHAAPLLVGIGNPGDGNIHVPERRCDYTPGAPAAAAPAAESGAAAFLAFIERGLDFFLEQPAASAAASHPSR